MKKTKKSRGKLIVLILLVLLITGCTKQLKGTDGKVITNPKTGQSLTENILCQPTDSDTIKIYTENGIDINSLPSCKSFSLTKSFKEYDGLWSTVFVKTLAWVLLKIGSFVGSYGLSLILVSLAMRLIAFPFTKKTAMQSELLQEAQPALQKLEKKYEGKDDQESMMRKSQEMAAIYKKYNINPVTGCLFALIQLPVFIAFFEAINRVPAIFEEKFIVWQLGTTPMVGITTGIGPAIFYIILTILVGVTTFFSLKLNSTSNPANAQAEQMNKIMFFMILFMSIFMTSAINIYWVITNLFTVVQNILVKKSKEERKKV
jgi:YidC/Oxa1 family membrane protein insertase